MAANNLQILITAKADQALAALRQTSEALIEMVTSSKAFQESVGFADSQLKSFNAILTETTIKTIGYSKLPKFVDAYDGVLSAVNTIAELNNKIDSVKKGLEEFGGIAIPTFETVKKEAFDVFKEFDSARAKVGTLTSEAGALAQQMQGLARETKNQYSSTVLLNASYDVLSAGFSKTADVSAIMSNSVKLAKAGFTDLGIASDAVTTILNAYGKNAGDAAAVANELIQTQNLGKLTVDQYGRSIGQVATIASQAGVGLTELNAVIAVATTKGLGASETITGFRQAIAAILSPTSQATAQAQALGIQFDAAALKSKGLTGVLQDIVAKGGATPEVLNKLFGSVEAVSAILPVTANNMADFQKAIVSLKTETGALDKAFDSVTGSIDSQLQAFKNRFQETLVGIGQGVAGWVRYLLAEGQKALGFFELLNPAQQLQAFQGIDGAISGVINTVKELIGTVVALSAGLAGVFIAEKLIAGYDASFKVFNLTLDIAAGRTQVLTVLQSAQAVAAQVLSAVMGVLTGTTTTYSLSLDFAAAKAGVLAAAQSALGVAMTFLNAVAIAQLKIMILTPVWALDAATGLFTLVAAQLKSALAIKIFGGSMSVATIATKVFTVATTFLSTQVLPIFVSGFKTAITQVLLLGPALVQIVGTVALFYGAFEAGKSIIDTFLLGLGRLTGYKFDDFSKNLAAVPGVAGAAVADAGVQLDIFNKLFRATLAILTLGVSEFTGFGDKAAGGLKPLDDATNKLATTIRNTAIQAVDELSAGVDRASNPIDKIATVVTNFLNLGSAAFSKYTDETSDAYNASSRFGSQLFQITKAQAEAQEQQIQWTAKNDTLIASLDRGNDILNKYGLQTLEVGEAAKLGADGIAAFRKEAESQIGSLSALIDSLKKVKVADAALQQQIDNVIKLLEGQKTTLQGRLVYLEEDAKKTGQAANAQKNASKTLEELSAAYKKNTDAIANNISEATVLIKEGQAKGTLNAKESQELILEVERKGFQDRIKLAESQLPLLRAKLVGETDKAKIKAVQDEILAVEKAGLDSRKSLADLQIKERIDNEQKAVKAIEDANVKAEAAVKISITNQVAAVKELGLSRETEAKRITDIEKNAAIARVQAIKDEIAQVQALQASGALSPEEGQKKLIALQGQLADANLARIEKVRAAENALRAEIIAGIEAQALKQKLADNDRIAGADKVLQSLKREQDLFSARSGLEAAQGDLAKARLENQLKITEALGNEGAAQQLKLQIQNQEIVNQERSFQAQLKSLEITQQIKAVELQRQAILDKIAIAEAEIALKRLAQKKGVTKDEIASQQQIIDAQREKAALTNQAIADQTTFNQYAKDELLTKQQATRETATATIAAEALKTVFGGINTATSGTTGAIASTTTAINGATTAANTFANAIAGMTENTKALVQQALAVRDAFAKGATSFQGSATGLGGNIQTAARGADGIIGSVGGKTVAGKQAEALAAGLQGFEKQAFLFAAKAKELESNGLINTEKVNIGGASFDYKEAASLFSQAASSNADVARLAQTALGSQIAQAQTRQVVPGSTLDEILKNVQQLKRDRLVGFAGGTRGQPIKSGIAMVGEKGAELINVTPQGTHVLSNGDSAKFMGGFAEGTGNLKDFYNSQAIAKKQQITDIGQELRSKLNSGAGLNVDSANKVISALNRIGSVQPYIDSVASALAEGMPLSAKAIAEDFRSKFLKGTGAISSQSQFGIYAGEVQAAYSLLAQFANLKVPSFAKGVTNFQGGLAMVHGGEALVNMARGTDVIPKGAARNSGGAIAPVTNNNTINIVNRPNPSADITAALLATR